MTDTPQPFATPVRLEGAYVCLEPLSLDHVPALVEAAREWNLSPEHVTAGVHAALEQQRAGSALPFTTVHRPSGQVVGGTRFLSIVPEHRRLEIGSTWIAAPWRRTAVNTEAKLLMLEHAFERLGCVRVELRTDAENTVSRAAILRLGAVEEGTFRNYAIAGDGGLRHMVYHSIIVSEWPAVQARLRYLLDRRR